MCDSSAFHLPPRRSTGFVFSIFSPPTSVRVSHIVYRSETTNNYFVSVGFVKIENFVRSRGNAKTALRVYELITSSNPSPPPPPPHIPPTTPLNVYEYVRYNFTGLTKCSGTSRTFIPTKIVVLNSLKRTFESFFFFRQLKHISEKLKKQ